MSPTDHPHFCMFASDQVGINAIGNYSVSPTSLIIKPDGNDVLHVARLLVFIEDEGKFDADKYGNAVTLTNGIEVKVYRGGTETIDLTAGEPVKSNAGWKKHCHNFLHSDYGIGNEMGSARWTFTKSGLPVGLDGSQDDEIRVELNDDFTSLLDHTFMFQGVKYIENA